VGVVHPTADLTGRGHQTPTSGTGELPDENKLPDKNSSRDIEEGKMTTTETGTNALFPGPTWTSHHFVDELTMDDQFKHYLSMMFFGMSDLGECLEVARQISPNDEDSWISAWSAMAERVEARAQRADHSGKNVTASSAYLRASTYWRASLMHFGHHEDPRVVDHAKKSRRCYDRYLELSNYPGQYLEIPYEGSFLPAYFYSAPDAPSSAPLLVFNQGRDAWPEDTRWVYDGAIRRGIHCLAFHGPGQGLAIRLNHLPFRHDWEKVVTPVLDVACDLPGVDAARIATMGLSFGGYLVPRAAAFEKRVKVCVANPGVLSWGQMLRASWPEQALEAFSAGPDAFNRIVGELLTESPTHGWFFRDSCWKHGVSTAYELFQAFDACDNTPVVDQITCETLVMDGTEEVFWHGQARKFFDALRCPKHYMLLDETTTAQLHCQNGANATAAELMFDWLDERL
jgi:hypothetical protein